MKDLFTDEEFTPKRKWQKFANSKNRIAFHNTKAAILREHKSKIDRPLHVNYLILEEEMQGKNESTVSHEWLRGRRFNFNVHTHMEKVGPELCTAIYQFILLHQGTQTKIIRNDRYENYKNH